MSFMTGKALNFSSGESLDLFQDVYTAINSPLKYLDEDVHTKMTYNNILKKLFECN